MGIVKTSSFAICTVLLMVVSAAFCVINAEGSDAEEINLFHPDNWVTVEASPGDTIRYEKSAPSSNYRFYGQVYFYHGSTDTAVDTALYTATFTKLDSGRSGYFVLTLGESIPAGDYRVETKLYNSRVSSEPDTVYGFYLHVIGYDHTVTYDANGGEGNVGDTVVSDGNENADVVLAPNGFTKTGNTFIGWMVGDTVYQPGQTVPVGPNATVVAVAQWSENTLVASAGDIDGVSGMFYSNQIGASASNGAVISFEVASCTGGTATVNPDGTVTYEAPSVTATTSYTVTVTVTATFGDGQTLTEDVSFTVNVDPVLSFTNSATSGTLSVKGV